MSLSEPGGPGPGGDPPPDHQYRGQLVGSHQGDRSSDTTLQAGEATNLNLAHMMEVDATDVEDLTRSASIRPLSNITIRAEMEGREQAMYALQVVIFLT